MNYLSPKIVFQLQVLIVCGASMVISNSNVTTCSCYAFHEQIATWTESENNCSDDGGHLVTMETEKEWEFIKSEIQKRSTYLDEWYIGLKNKSNAFKWINDKNLTIEKWQNGQPSRDGECVIMARNYPPSDYGLWNDLSCTKNRGFICEYEGSGKCNSSKIFFCDHKTKPTERAVTTTVICTISDPDRFNLLYVVIALGILLAGGIVFYIYIFYCKNRNSGFSNECCQEYKTFKFKNRTSLGLEEGAMRLQTEPETVVEDDSNKTDREMEIEMENSAGLQNPAQDVLPEDTLNKDYTSPVDPSSTSTYASLYSSIGQKKPEENEDIKPPKVPSPYHKASGEPVVYATIDKSKKTKGKSNKIEVVYATVDKKRKDTKGNS